MPSSSCPGTCDRLPSPADGWHDRYYSVLLDGTISILRTDAPFSKTDPATIRTQAFHFDGKTETRLFPDAELPSLHSLQLLPDGNWLQCRWSNSKQRWEWTVCTTHGVLLRTLDQAGMCAPDGTFWVGFNDQLIFSDDPPFAWNGIVQISADGQVIWGYNGSKPSDVPPIDDCYALSLNGNDAWSCNYTGFDISRVCDGDIRLWKNDTISGAFAMAVDDPYVLLFGGYGPEINRVAVLELNEEKATLLGSRTFPTGFAPPALFAGRDDTIHLISSGTWTKMTVREALDRVRKTN